MHSKFLIQVLALDAYILQIQDIKRQYDLNQQ